MSQKIIITKPHGYYSLDDACELELKTFKSYKKLLEKDGYEAVNADLKDVGKYLSQNDCGLAIAEVPNGADENKMHALAKCIEKLEKQFISKQLILISDEEGLFNKPLMDAFAKHGTFLYLKPIKNEHDFSETIDNACKLYWIDKLIRYFKIGPVSRKFEEYLIKEAGDPDTGHIKHLQNKTTYFLPKFQLMLEEQQLFTSVERYLNIFIEPSEFNNLNIELLEYKFDYELKHNEKVNIHMCVKESE